MPKMTRMLIAASIIAASLSSTTFADRNVALVMAGGANDMAGVANDMAGGANDAAGGADLLSAGSHVDTVDVNGNTPLMVAAALGYTEVVGILIDNDADVNACGRIGNTALIYAVQEGHTDIVRMLLDASATVNVKNDYGSNPRALALGYGKRDIVEILNTIPEGELASPSGLLARLSK